MPGKTAIICPIILGCELDATARVIRTMKNMKVHLEQIDPDRDILFWSINYLPTVKQTSTQADGDLTFFCELSVG